MKERPILFTPENTRRIISGEKVQTRRVLKQQPPTSCAYLTQQEHPLGMRVWGFTDGGTLDPAWWPWIENEQAWLRCPYGVPGDRLYIKEGIVKHASIPHLVGYRLDGCKVTESWEKHLTAMFMPKWAARYWLEITNIKVERVQDITAEDALAEGISKTDYWKPKEVDGKPFEEKWWDDYEFWQRYPQIAFKNLWDSINKKKHSWDSNPWCWCISFRRLKEQL